MTIKSVAKAPSSDEDKEIQLKFLQSKYSVRSRVNEELLLDGMVRNSCGDWDSSVQSIQKVYHNNSLSVVLWHAAQGPYQRGVCNWLGIMLPVRLEEAQKDPEN